MKTNFFKKDFAKRNRANQKSDFCHHEKKRKWSLGALVPNKEKLLGAHVPTVFWQKKRKELFALFSSLEAKSAGFCLRPQKRKKGEKEKERKLKINKKFDQKHNEKNDNMP